MSDNSEHKETNSYRLCASIELEKSTLINLEIMHSKYDNKK